MKTRRLYVTRKHVQYFDGPPGNGLREVRQVEPGTILPDSIDPKELHSFIDSGLVTAYDVPLTTEEGTTR